MRMGRRKVRYAGSRKRFNINKSAVGRIRQPVQYFKRSFISEGFITAPAGGPTFGTIQFTLNQLPNYTEFTQLYDQYKIKGVKVKLVPRYNVADINAQAISQLLTVLDYDDSTSPTAVSDLLQYQNMKMTMTNKIHQRYLAPRSNRNVAQPGPASPPAASPVKQWIDCGFPTVLHHGIKYAVTAGSIDIKYDLYCTYYVAFKNVR